MEFLETFEKFQKMFVQFSKKKRSIVLNLDELKESVNPIPTGHGGNQPIYERHVTKSGRNRVKTIHF